MSVREWVQSVWGGVYMYSAPTMNRPEEPLSACGRTYLAIVEGKNERHLVAVDAPLRHLGRHPALGQVRLPRLGADIVHVRHGRGGSVTATHAHRFTSPTTALHTTARPGSLLPSHRASL